MNETTPASTAPAAGAPSAEESQWGQVDDT